MITTIYQIPTHFTQYGAQQPNIITHIAKYGAQKLHLTHLTYIFTHLTIPQFRAVHRRRPTRRQAVTAQRLCCAIGAAQSEAG